MAQSPAHRFGQMIGQMLEEIVRPELERFCLSRGLYLDQKGKRGKARPGRKVSWADKFGNLHDLDFVIEKDGTSHTRGRPLAFIEVAWRRYTKHSRNKAQEIQGAILPIVEQHPWDKPFLGCVLAGIFTKGALDQLKSTGFEVLYFPYDTVVAAFNRVGIDVDFDENTPDEKFAKCVGLIEGLTDQRRQRLFESLLKPNGKRLEHFLESLRKSLDRMVDEVLIVPLFGNANQFKSAKEAVDFLAAYSESDKPAKFKKYEVIIRFSNGDRIQGSFEDKKNALEFIGYAVA